MTSHTVSFRWIVLIVVLLNPGYFVIEFTVALSIGSMSLLADSTDFFKDAAVSFLISAAFGWNAVRRAKVGMLLSAVLFAPVIAFLRTLWQKIAAPVPPDPISLTFTGLGALVISLIPAFLLVHYRHQGGSLTRLRSFRHAMTCWPI